MCALKDITVEPSLLLYQLTFEMIRFINANLYLQKTCRFNQTSEPDLDTQCDNEKSGVLFVAEINSKFYVVSELVCAVFTIFATIWSDEAGRRRRPLVFLPILGQILLAISGCLHSYFWTWKPVYGAFFEVMFECLTGGVCLFSAASQMYICDVSNLENRTMRLGILGTVKTIALLIGTGGAGFILHFFGFFYSFVLCLLCSVISLSLAFVFVKDISIPGTKIVCKISCSSNIVDSFRVIFRKKLGNIRIIVVLLLAAYTLGYFTIFGELSVLYLYLRYKFQWNEQTYSAYLLYRFSLSAMGNLFASVVLSKRLKIHDGLIGAFAGVINTIAIISLLLATKNWQIYLIPILDVFHNTVFVVGISHVSKYYQSSELGRLNAVVAVFLLVYAATSPIYSMIFQHTLDFFPSAFCVASIILDIGIILLFLMSYVVSKKVENLRPIAKEEKPMIFSS